VRVNPVPACRGELIRPGRLPKVGALGEVAPTMLLNLNISPRTTAWAGNDPVISLHPKLALIESDINCLSSTQIGLLPSCLIG
jgi:hypothetical protein